MLNKFSFNCKFSHQYCGTNHIYWNALSRSNLIDKLNEVLLTHCPLKWQIYPCTGLDRSRGLLEVEAPRIFRHSEHEGDKTLSPTHRPPLLISVRVDHGAIVWPERLSKLKKSPRITSGVEPATFRLVAQCVNQRGYRVSLTLH